MASRSPHADWPLLARLNAWVTAGLGLLVLASPVVVLIGYLEGEPAEGWAVAGWMLLLVLAVAVLRLLPRLLGAIARGPGALRRGWRELHAARADVLDDVGEPARTRLAALPTRTWLRLQVSLSRLAWRRLRAGDPDEDPTLVVDRLAAEVAAGGLDPQLARVARRVPARHGVEVTDLRSLVRAMAENDENDEEPV